MFKIMLALHLLAAVFAIGPLVHAATTASRGLRQGDGAAALSSARTLRIYSYASVLVVIFGFGLMSADAPWNKNEKVAEFSEPWIWISLLLWLASIALTLGVLAPSLTKVSTTAEGAVDSSLTARVAATGGVVGLIYAAIIVLMVYQPGG